MATYVELKEALTNNDYVERVTMAVLVKATLVLADVNAIVAHKTWANNAIAQGFPRGTAVEILTRLLMANRNSTLTQIQNVLGSDSSTQTQVNTFIDAHLTAL